jgi:predicted Zn-dependent protease
MLAALIPLEAKTQAAPPETTSSARTPERSGCTSVQVSQSKLETWKHRAELASAQLQGQSNQSEERERQFGEKFALEIDRRTRLSTDAQVQDALRAVAQRLTATATTGTPITLKVIESDDLNVFSLPGGFLYVTTGLLKSTQSEAQLAGLFGHEMVHIVAHHGTRQRRKQAITAWASLPLLFVGPAGYLVKQIAAVTTPLKFSRDAEREADVIGINLLDQAGYDATDYLNWLKSNVQCNSEMPSRLGRMFDSYPVFQERLALIEFRIAASKTSSQLIVSTSGFDEMRTALIARGATDVRQKTKKPALRRRTQ